MPIYLVLADDHPLILDALEHLFCLEQGFQVLARCQDGDATLVAVRQHQPDVLVLDLRMPGTDGLAVLRELARTPGATRVVILTAVVDSQEVIEAVRLGVAGVVLKEMAPQLLVQCVRTVAAGGQWFERGAVSRALETYMRQDTSRREATGRLTARELDIMRLVASGLRNKNIAESLSLSEGTVKVHLHNIYEKLRVNGRLALTLYARNKGLV